jgi:hypothetical protein
MNLYKKFFNKNIYIRLVAITIWLTWWKLGHSSLLSQAFRWESLWQWDLGHNLLLPQAFRWESLWRWDLGHNLLWSQAFRWESLWLWDLGFHGASGYHKALSQTLPLSRWNSSYHEAFHTNFLFLGGISAITKCFSWSFVTRWYLGYHEAFSQFFLLHGGISAITEPFHEFFFYMVESRLSRSLFMNFSFTWWNLGYHGAFSRIFFSHDGISAITEPFHEFFCSDGGIHKMHNLGKTLFIYITKSIYIDPPR